MVFSSPVFLYYFLPITLISYFFVGLITQKKINGQNIALLIFSLIFYGYGSGKYVLLLLAMVLSSYFFGLFIDNAKRKHLLLGFGVSGPLLLLGVFKYTNFLVEQIGSLASILGLPQLPKINIILPIGISFYTFQSLTYVIDVYYKREKPEKNFLNLLLYISMFPQLIAGPIVRYSEVAKQLHNRITNLNDFSSGATRFIYGLSKKVIIADACGIVADTAYNVPIGTLSTPVALIGAYAYFLQIYFDFSAYSDMAIGLGRILGFHFPENFNRPYSSSSITEFWRRWHMTMSFWFRDYLYFPLGGNRKGKQRTYFNLWVVFLCTGLWHGANWTFVLWGIYHGALISAERLLDLRKHEQFDVFWRVSTILLIYLGWILFRAESLTQAFAFYSHIFFPTNWEMVASMRNVLTHKNLLLISIGSSIIFFPKDLVIGKYLENEQSYIAVLAKTAVVTVVMLFSIILISSNNYSPFVYFQF